LKQKEGLSAKCRLLVVFPVHGPNVESGNPYAIDTGEPSPIECGEAAPLKTLKVFSSRRIRQRDARRQRSASRADSRLYTEPQLGPTPSVPKEGCVRGGAMITLLGSRIVIEIGRQARLLGLYDFFFESSAYAGVSRLRFESEDYRTAAEARQTEMAKYCTTATPAISVTLDALTRKTV